MSRKVPGSLALLLGAGWLFAQTASADVVGAIDTPTQNQTVSGVVRVSGFALDFTPISKIEILVDGIIVNQADMNIPRADVLEIFPNYVGSPTNDPGFLSSFLARNYSNGSHSLTVKITESTNAVTMLGPVSVNVDNNINQAPFGYIDIPGPTGTQSASGSFPVTGWAVDDQDIDHIDFLVDGEVVAGAVGRGQPSTAVFGSPRPDVYAAFPDFPGPAPKSLFSGFIANIDTTDFLDGLHVITVRATDNQGLSSQIGTRTVQIENNGANLMPFGNIDFPLDKASLQCSAPAPPSCPSPCTQPQASDIPNLTKGWALDTGARLDKGQVAYVELLIDGAIIANTRKDCVLSNGVFYNCYGVNRPDVAQLFPGYVNADNAGFNFVYFFRTNPSSGQFDILIPNSTPSSSFTPNLSTVGTLTSGKHTMAVRVGDDKETVVELGAMSFDVICDLVTGDVPSIGFIDSPSPYEFVQGIIPVSGWAFDFNGIHTNSSGVTDGVEVDIDGQVVASAQYGLFRPDVPINDPRVGANTHTGFFYALDTTKLTDGEHEVVIYVADSSSTVNPPLTPPNLFRRTEIGRRKFVVQNNVIINH
ncbi:MAG TPA: Ig-like domain-containing protein [Thermoanaerobaculia bacterium]|nr:Ig-like domain-containing protein [Thermoanaerobaculia bacterium]